MFYPAMQDLEDADWRGPLKNSQTNKKLFLWFTRISSKGNKLLLEEQIGSLSEVTRGIFPKLPRLSDTCICCVSILSLV